LKVVPRGTEGAVSLEGTAAGVAAAALFAGIAFLLKLVRTMPSMRPVCDVCTQANSVPILLLACLAIGAHHIKRWASETRLFVIRVHFMDFGSIMPLSNLVGTLQVTMQGAGVVAAAAIVANLFESFLGAALQGKALWLTNDIVNAIQISLAASIALVMTAYLYTCSLLYAQVRLDCEMSDVSVSLVKACCPEKMGVETVSMSVATNWSGRQRLLWLVVALDLQLLTVRNYCYCGSPVI